MANLELRVHGIRDKIGNLTVVVWDHVDRFRSNDEGHAFRVLRAPIGHGDHQTVTVPDLPAGSYGYVVLHDEDGNDRLDFDFTGVPNEGVGFSRNPDGEPASAEWADCSFEMIDTDVRHEVQMRYWSRPSL